MLQSGLFVIYVHCTVQSPVNPTPPGTPLNAPHEVFCLPFYGYLSHPLDTYWLFLKIFGATFGIKIFTLWRHYDVMGPSSKCALFKKIDFFCFSEIWDVINLCFVSVLHQIGSWDLRVSDFIICGFIVTSYNVWDELEFTPFRVFFGFSEIFGKPFDYNSQNFHRFVGNLITQLLVPKFLSYDVIMTSCQVKTAVKTRIFGKINHISKLFSKESCCIRA